MLRRNCILTMAVIALLLVLGAEPMMAQGVPAQPAPGNPWDYAPLEGAVGTLGAALGGIGGAFIGGLAGGLIGCALDRPTGCVAGVAIGAIVGHVIGVLNGAVWGIKLVGSAYRVNGNLTLATLMALGGWLVIGQIPLPATRYIGAGIGATLGYNIGATIEAKVSLRALSDHLVASSSFSGLMMLTQ